MAVPWQAKSGCPSHLRGVIERFVNERDPAWRLPPASKGEVFDSFEQCQQRLNVWAMVEGFAIVVRGHGISTIPCKRFRCIHHGEETRNDRELEDDVEKDSEGRIISERQRGATHTKQKECKWYAYCSFKNIGKKTSGIKGYCLIVRELSHSHRLVDNPLIYTENANLVSEYHQLVTTAIKHRINVVPYSQSRRILDSEDLGLFLSAKKYYNLVRNQPADKGDSESIQGLLKALDDDKFIHHQRVESEFDTEGKMTNKRLIQIWFAHPKQLAMAQRFVADQVLVVDGTFNTNNLRLPLLVAVGVMSSGSTFPVAFSYCPSESKESFLFFFECLQRELFIDSVPPCRVVIGDQAGGLIAAVPVAFPNAILQSCDWHAVQAMLKRFRTSGYKKDNVDILQDLCWTYVKSATVQDLEDNRQRLLNELKPAEQRYITETWLPKEDRVVYYYTNTYMNLGCTSSSRSESYHPVIRAMVHGQLSLEQSVKRLVATVLSIFKTLDSDEDTSQRDRPHRLQRDRAAFRFLFDEISLFALNKLVNEWEMAKQIAADQENLNSELCRCELLLRWYLPCKHHLLSVARSGQPIPKSLIHPRWWIKGPIIRFSDWKPQNQEENEPGVRQTNYLSPQRRQHTFISQDLLGIRDALSVTDRAELDRKIAQNDERILDLARDAYEGRAIPVANPLPIPKKKWVPKKAHNKANARGLTGAEIAARELNARERAQRVQESKQLALNHTFDPPSSGALYAGKEVAVVTGRGGEVLAIRATPPLAEDIQQEAVEGAEKGAEEGVEEGTEEGAEEDPLVLPASTAPALLETNVRPKRARGPTLNYKAMHEGRQMQPKRSREA